MLSYQTSVAVIKAKLSGYVPVCMVFNGGHIRVLDRATEMVKLQLQTRGFLHVWRACMEGEKLYKVIQGDYSNQRKVPVSMSD